MLGDMVRLQFTLRLQLHLNATCAIFLAWCYWLPWMQGVRKFWFPNWIGMFAIGFIVASGIFQAKRNYGGREAVFTIGCLLALFNFLYAQLTFKSFTWPTLPNIALEWRRELIQEAVYLGTIPLLCALVCSYPAWCMSPSVPTTSRRWLRLALAIAAVDIVIISTCALLAYDFGAELARSTPR